MQSCQKDSNLHVVMEHTLQRLVLLHEQVRYVTHECVHIKTNALCLQNISTVLRHCNTKTFQTHPHHQLQFRLLTSNHVCVPIDTE